MPLVTDTACRAFKDTRLRKTPGSGKAAEGTSVKEKASYSSDMAKSASNGWDPSERGEMQKKGLSNSCYELWLIWHNNGCIVKWKKHFFFFHKIYGSGVQSREVLSWLCGAVTCIGTCIGAATLRWVYIVPCTQIHAQPTHANSFTLFLPQKRHKAWVAWALVAVMNCLDKHGIKMKESVYHHTRRHTKKYKDYQTASVLVLKDKTWKVPKHKNS